MHYGAAVDIVEIVRGLIERFMVVWRHDCERGIPSESPVLRARWPNPCKPRVASPYEWDSFREIHAYLQSCWPGHCRAEFAETGPLSSQVWRQWPLPILVCTHRLHSHRYKKGGRVRVLPEFRPESTRRSFGD